MSIFSTFLCYSQVSFQRSQYVAAESYQLSFTVLFMEKEKDVWEREKGCNKKRNKNKKIKN